MGIRHDKNSLNRNGTCIQYNAKQDGYCEYTFSASGANFTISFRNHDRNPHQTHKSVVKRYLTKTG